MKGIRLYHSIENMILFHDHTPHWRYHPSHARQVTCNLLGPNMISSDAAISKSIFSAICCDILNILDDADTMGRYPNFVWSEFTLLLSFPFDGTSYLVQNAFFH